MTGTERQSREPTIALVIEDEPEVRNIASSVLKDTDLAVIESSTGEDALAFLRENAPDVAMMFADVNLPGTVDGVDLARIAESSWPWIKVVLTTGGMERPLSDLPRTAVFMPKPWRARDVLAEAKRVTRH
jgi:CheY-like chemotaxis protein